MYNYYSNLIEDYRIADRRATIYVSVIKEHKKELKKYNKKSKEYREIKEMIKFIKQMDDYKKVYKNMVVSMFALSRI